MPTLLQNIKFITSAIGQNESRKNLMVVKCWSKDEYFHMLAADGFIIKTVKMWKNFPHAYFVADDVHFYIDFESVKKILKIAKKDSVFTLYEDSVIVDNVRISYKKYECDYPNLDNIINSDIQVDQSKFAFNYDFMTKCLKDAYFDDKRNCYAKISFVTNENNKKTKSPINKIEFENGEQTAFVMPVVTEW